ncbi:hypothetical protein [Pseudomonas azotoformans]|uniref:hypothetical protein n=1 Tax=Pseudomonas azotoformans TaxID=47878 RepID=UPI0012EAAA02|nr:hypothetical protein [Pseudomonas azotoformans]
MLARAHQIILFIVGLVIGDQAIRPFWGTDVQQQSWKMMSINSVKGCPPLGHGRFYGYVTEPVSGDETVSELKHFITRNTDKAECMPVGM